MAANNCNYIFTGPFQNQNVNSVLLQFPINHAAYLACL